jgi:hypothetical protein
MKRYLIVFALVSLLSAALCIPVHNLPRENLMLLSSYAKSKDKILFFGNSVNDATSACDRDTRNVPMLTADDAGAAIIDMSRGGMTLGQMLQLAETGARTGVEPATIIFPISPEAGFFRSATTAHGMRAFLSDNLPALASQLTASVDTPPPTDYRGKRYGDYGEFAKQYFSKEKAGASCPDNAGINQEFVKFMYWRNFLQKKDPLMGFDEVLPRISQLKQKNIHVVFWMTPVNFGDLGRLHGAASVEEVKRQIVQVKTGLERNGFTVVDSSGLVTTAGFTDRWCACGHMSQEGRKIAAASLAAWINQRPADAALPLPQLSQAD